MKQRLLLLILLGSLAAHAQQSQRFIGPPARHAASAREADIAAWETEERTRNTLCESGELHGKPCRVSWARVLGSSFLFLTAQHLSNIGADADTRRYLSHGNFWSSYARCVSNYRWSRWRDDDPFAVDWIGHPMMGALTSSIYEQNDPKQRALTFQNTHGYWVGRLNAMAYSAAYSAQWKVGPLSEASIGSTGYDYYYRKEDGLWTNETGMEDFFVTPIVGLVWNVGEDVIDRYVLGWVRTKTRRRTVLFVASILTPTRSVANLSRFRPPYYRDQDAHSMPNPR